MAFFLGSQILTNIYLAFHFRQLGSLEIQHLEKVVSQGVDLVSHGRQTLGSVSEIDKYFIS